MSAATRCMRMRSIWCGGRGGGGGGGGGGAGVDRDAAAAVEGGVYSCSPSGRFHGGKGDYFTCAAELAGARSAGFWGESTGKGRVISLYCVVRIATVNLL